MTKSSLSWPSRPIRPPRSTRRSEMRPEIGARRNCLRRFSGGWFGSSAISLSDRPSANSFCRAPSSLIWASLAASWVRRNSFSETARVSTSDLLPCVQRLLQFVGDAGGEIFALGVGHLAALDRRRRSRPSRRCRRASCAVRRRSPARAPRRGRCDRRRGSASPAPGSGASACRPSLRQRDAGVADLLLRERDAGPCRRRRARLSLRGRRRHGLRPRQRRIGHPASAATATMAATPAAMPATKRTIRFICAFPLLRGPRPRVLRDRSRQGDARRRARRSSIGRRGPDQARGGLKGDAGSAASGAGAAESAIKSRHIFDTRGIVLRGYGRDMGEAVTTMRPGRARKGLTGFTGTRLRGRGYQRGLITIKAATAIE